MINYFFQNLFTFFWSNTSFKTFSCSYDLIILLSKPFHIILIKYFFQNLFAFIWSNTFFKTCSHSSEQILLSKPFHILLNKYFFQNLFIFLRSNNSSFKFFFQILFRNIRLYTFTLLHFYTLNAYSPMRIVSSNSGNTSLS